MNTLTQNATLGNASTNNVNPPFPTMGAMTSASGQGVFLKNRSVSLLKLHKIQIQIKKTVIIPQRAICCGHGGLVK